jgi:uncharacterized membrane-anchored protein
MIIWAHIISMLGTIASALAVLMSPNILTVITFIMFAITAFILQKTNENE